MSKKVVVIDDDELFRAGLTRLIDSFDDFEVKLSISSADYMNLITQDEKTVDYNLVIYSPPSPSSYGVKFCKKAARFFAPAPLMIFSNIFSKQSVLKALECGVSAYYTKGISPYDLEDIMDELTSRKNFSDIKLESKIRNVLVSEEMTSISFTDAEEEVLNLVCEQKSSAEISDNLGISVRTVESRKRNMMLKTHSKNMIGVVMIFVRSQQYQKDGQRPPGD